MKRRLARVLAPFAVVGALAVGVTGCSDPCAGVPVTENHRQITAMGGEADTERGGYDCEYNPDTDQFEMED